MQREAVGDPGDLTAGTPGAAVAGTIPGTTASPGDLPGHVSEASADRAQAPAGPGLPAMAEGVGTAETVGMGMGMGKEITDITAVQPPASGAGLVWLGLDGPGGDTTLETPAELSDVAARFKHDAGGGSETGIAR